MWKKYIEGGYDMFIYGKYFKKLKSQKYNNNKVASMLLDTLEILIDAVLIIAIFYILFDNRLVPTGSMIPNVEINEKVFFEKPSIYLNHINKSDVILFDATVIAPVEEKQTLKENFVMKLLKIKSTEIDYLKRVVATSGDKLFIQNGKIFINDKEFKQTYDTVQGDTYSMEKPVIVPNGYVFAMGDNRTGSYDGRFWGMYNPKLQSGNVDGFKYVDGITFVSTKQIKAKALFSYSITKFKFKWLR